MFRVRVFPPYVYIVEPLAACSLSRVDLADGGAVAKGFFAPKLWERIETIAKAFSAKAVR